jgi:CheY-like chemotaxis protein
MDGAELRRQTNSFRRILVVDDEESMRWLIVRALAGCGYEVDEAEDGAVAWEALQAKHYDLLVTDNSMPKITGIGLVRMLQDHALTLPVIMATGTPPTEDLERYPPLKISAVLLKPYDIQDLLETVKKTLVNAGRATAEPQLPLFPATDDIWQPVALHAHPEAAEKLVL